MTTEQKHSPMGIAIIAFLIALGASIGFYQFTYLPIILAKPHIPEEVLNPTEETHVRIIRGSLDPEQQDNYIPKRIELELEINNRVIWTNNDEIGHTVTHDDFVDPYSGPFDSMRQMGGLIQPGESWEFLFTQEGEFDYYCIPHPWMNGKVIVHHAKF